MIFMDCTIKNDVVIRLLLVLLVVLPVAPLNKPSDDPLCLHEHIHSRPAFAEHYSVFRDDK